MVGNDVVDLGDREARTGPAHSRFDTRVFSAGERRAIAAAQDEPTTMACQECAFHGHVDAAAKAPASCIPFFFLFVNTFFISVVYK